MSSSLSRAGSFEASPFCLSGDAASSLEWLKKDVPDCPLHTGRDDSASVKGQKNIQNSLRTVKHT